MISGPQLPALPASGADSRSLLPYGAVRALPAPPATRPARDEEAPRRYRPVDRQAEADGETGTNKSAASTGLEFRQGNSASVRSDGRSDEWTGGRTRDSAPFVAQAIA